VRRFEWFAGTNVPHDCDLRRLGWILVAPVDNRCAEEAPPLIAMPSRAAVTEWVMLLGAARSRRRRVLAIGVDEPAERTRLLRMGFGDVTAAGVLLDEVETRAERIVEALAALPRQRQIGPLTLDLLQREAFVAGRPTGLHPREFLLLWRLAEEPGAAVSPQALRRDVWRMAFRPETNSLAVHVSRLRAKLRTAGLDGLVASLGDGTYRLAGEMLRPALAMASGSGLDDHLRLREEA
jgi:DNA-binding response OmpR family regulator